MTLATNRTLQPAGPGKAAGTTDLMREAEAQCALAELFPHLRLEALRAIQELFPIQVQLQLQQGAARSVGELVVC